MTFCKRLFSLTLGVAVLGLGGCGGGSGRYVGTDLAVTGTGPSAPLYGGEAAMFVMTVSNRGDYDATNVVIKNATVQLSQAALTVNCAATGGAVCPPTTGPSMSVSSMPSGGTLVFNVSSTANPGASGSVSNTMTVSADSLETDRNNNSSTVSVAVTSNDVNVTATPPPGPLLVTSATFTMVVGNAGPDVASAVSLATSISDDLTLVPQDIVCVPSGGAIAPTLQADDTLLSPSIPVTGLLTCSVPVTVKAGSAGSVKVSMTAAALGDSRVANNTGTASVGVNLADLGVTQSVALQVAAGSSTVFTAMVSNPGPGTANNVQIDWTHTSSAEIVFDEPTCKASGGATCPAVLGPAMTVASLGPGRTLAFNFNVTPDAAYRGMIVNTVTVASDEGGDPGNDSASVSTLVVDPLSGTYTAFAANGKSYSLVIDFDAGTYTLSGNGVTANRSFVLEAATGDYVVSGNARLRVGQDVLIAGHDFGSGVIPLIAARVFGAGLGAMAGSYNLATRNVDGSGVATTRPGTAVISGNTLSICQNENVDVQQVRNCSVAARKDYLSLSLSDNVVTGTATSGESYSFSIANSGAAKILLSAGAAVDGSQQLRIGLIDSSGGLTYGPALRGPSSTGDWLSSTLTDGAPPVFASVGTSSSDTVSLLNITNSGAGPFSMLEGTSATYNSLVYVMQANPLIVVVGGAPGYTGASSGFLQLGLP